ncbi:protease-4 [Clostridiales Family XIII bacterium PM5-7]
MDKEKNQEQRQVHTYDPDTLFRKPQKNPKDPNWKKGLVIFLIIAVVVVGVCVACNNGMEKFGEAFFSTEEESYDFNTEYIGVLAIQGTITNGTDASEQYNHSWLMERVDAMKNDPLNKGMILRVNTPGGSVYATDELYLSIMDYKKTTGRPVYTYMEANAMSGGYYIAMASDEIYANRNCWTGSIGVTLGTKYDFSGFLEKMGVKTVTITSGDNKAMGSSVDPMTKEQMKIYQDLVDDAFSQFVDIVAEGRDMSISQVKKLADGRVYTAKQAKKNGLIDQISTLEEATKAMQKTYELENCQIEMINYTPSFNFFSWLTSLSNSSSEAESEINQMKMLMEENEQFTVTYFSNVRK